MAEIFGAVAASIAVCGQLIKVGRSIQKAATKIRHARRDIADLADETIIFAGMYQRFLRACAEDLGEQDSTLPAVERLKYWTQATIDDLRELLRKVRALGSHPRYRASLPETVAAHVKWFFSKRSVDGLRVSLSVARESMNGFSNLMCISRLDMELKMLRAALRNEKERRVIEEKLGMTLEDKIRLSQQEMYVRQKETFRLLTSVGGLRMRCTARMSKYCLVQREISGYIKRKNHLSILTLQPKRCLSSLSYLRNTLRRYYLQHD
jgi:hypothetical protein